MGQRGSSAIFFDYLRNSRKKQYSAQLFGAVVGKILSQWVSYESQRQLRVSRSNIIRLFCGKREEEREVNEPSILLLITRRCCNSSSSSNFGSTSPTFVVVAKSFCEFGHFFTLRCCFCHFSRRCRYRCCCHSCRSCCCCCKVKRLTEIFPCQYCKILFSVFHWRCGGEGKER